MFKSYALLPAALVLLAGCTSSKEPPAADEPFCQEYNSIVWGKAAGTPPDLNKVAELLNALASKTKDAALAKQAESLADGYANSTDASATEQELTQRCDPYKSADDPTKGGG